jgi:hypothetical protein
VLCSSQINASQQKTKHMRVLLNATPLLCGLSTSACK